MRFSAAIWRKIAVMFVRDSLRAICLLAVVCAAAAAWAEGSSLNAHRLAGGEYVAIGDLARFYSLGHNKSGSSERAEYQTAFAQLFLQADRREIQLNGVEHWLSAPVLWARGQLWITAVDVLKTIDPVLRHGQSRTPSVIHTIVIDPGHGGADRGARGSSGIEKEMTLDVSKRLERYLERERLPAVLTRTVDNTVSLEERVDFAESKHADLFVSIHFNSGGAADGIETYCMAPAGTVSTANASRPLSRSDDELSPGNRFDEKDVWLAHCVQKSLLRTTGAVDRGVRRARFYVLRYASCPAILVEAGFLSNRIEEQKILTPEYRDQLAKAIAEGILTYKKSVETK